MRLQRISRHIGRERQSRDGRLVNKGKDHRRLGPQLCARAQHVFKRGGANCNDNSNRLVTVFHPEMSVQTVLVDGAAKSTEVELFMIDGNLRGRTRDHSGSYAGGNSGIKWQAWTRLINNQHRARQRLRRQRACKWHGRERPCDRCAAKKHDELAPLHVCLVPVGDVHFHQTISIDRYRSGAVTSTFFQV